MKNVLTCILLLIFSYAFAQQKPQIAFTVKEKDIIPEGIAYDASEKTFYLSSIHKRKILRINSNGVVSDFVPSAQDGIQQVLGMKVDEQGRLWACNNSPGYDSLNKISSIHVYELRTGKLVKKYQLSDGQKHLFNDLHFMSNGDAYITDSDGGGVYVIRKNKEELEQFIKAGSLRYPNGITATDDEKKILVSTGSSMGIVAIDVTSREIKPVSHSKFMIIGIDGLYRHKNSLIGVQNVLFPEAVLQFHLTASAEAIERMEFIASNDPLFDLPTTGVIADGYFYFIANSQLLQLVGNNGKIKDREKLADTFIMKIKLD